MLRSLTLLLVALSPLYAVRAGADVIVIDDTTVGTLYDGLVDGFPMVAPHDGTADVAGNTLGVGLDDGATEERGIAEMPLASLAGITSGDVESAVLTFNIDDFVSTFGPGTSFTAAPETIVLFSYAGNGAIELSDFQNVVGAPLGIVDTTPHGVINDASLAVSGPLFFDLDITAALQTALDNGNTHFGVVWATQDDKTFASIDNLGNGSAGPPGVNGSSMPFLTITTAADEPPVLSSNELGCQKAIGGEASKFEAGVRKELGRCVDAVLNAVSKGDDPVSVEESCRKGIDAANPDSKLAKARLKLADKIESKCQDVEPADIGSPCDPDAASIADVAACLDELSVESAQIGVRGAYDGACESLAAVGLDGDFPVVCTE